MPDELTEEVVDNNDELDQNEETQEDEEVLDTDESEGAEEDENDDSEEEEIPEDAFGEEDGEATTPAPLADLKDLIKTDPDAAIKRTSEVEQGLIKLQSQRNDAIAKLEPIHNLIVGIGKGDVEAMREYEQNLYEDTGMTFASMAEVLAGNTDVAENAKISNLERKLEALENERASTKWQSEIGATVASKVAKETGLEFSTQLLWLARPHLQRGATVDDVRRAVMRVDQIAYDKAVAKRDGDKKPLPKGATISNGRTGSKVAVEYTSAAYMKAYEAREKRKG